MTTGYGFKCLDHHNEKLISGSNCGSHGEIIAWNFNTGNRLKDLRMDEAVENLKVCWPFVVTCTWNSICIKLINIEEGKLIRSICCGNVRDIDIKGRYTQSVLQGTAYKGHFRLLVEF